MPKADNERLKALRTALSTDQVQSEEARLILRWYRDGSIITPDERSASFAREVLQHVGVEIDVLTEPGDDPDATRPTTKQSPKPTAEEPAETTKPPETIQKRRRKLSATGLSRAAKTWADKNPDEAAALIYYNAPAVIELIAPDARLSRKGCLLALLLRRVAQYPPAHLPQLLRSQSSPRTIVIAHLVCDDGELFLNGPAEALLVAARLPAASQYDIDDEPISVLAAARLQFAPVTLEKALIPPAPSIRIVEAPKDRLPDVPPAQPERQLILPAMSAADRPTIGTAPWLELFDRLGGQSMQRGTGAPAALRLWIEALAWASPAARNGRLGAIPLTVRDLRDALWPNGWNRGKQLPALIDACRRINGLAFLEAPDGRSQWAPVLWRQIPGRAAQLNDPVLLEVHLPPIAGAGAGAAFHRPTLRTLGLRSAPEYRAYLALIDLWDRYGRRGGAAPGRFLPALDPAQRRQLVFGDDDTARNPATLRSRQRDADRAIENLEDQGVIELRPDSDAPRRWRLLRRDLRRK